MRLLRTLPLLLILLVGCPEPTPPSPGGPGAKAPAGGADGASDGAEDRDADGRDDAGEARPAPPPAWVVIPQGTREDIYPTLQPVASWPDPVGLEALNGLERDAKERPSADRVQQLKQLVGSLVAKSLQPSDPDAALGIDVAGRLYMRLGRTKTLGSASMEVAGEESPFPVFAMTLEGKGEGAKTIESLRARVKKVVSSGLAAELGQEEHRLEAHPKVKGGAQIAGLAFLNRNGFGMQFPYVYAYAGDEHLMVVFQEVPHMKAPGSE